MKIENTREFIKQKAEEFGAKIGNEFHKPFVERNNTSPDALRDNGAFFGFIHPEEEVSGPFHDFSLTLFPNNQDKPWLVCLGIGSHGFKNDYELATYPGLRRLFSKLTNERGFCKTDFSDIETGLPKSIMNNSDLQHIKNTLRTYTKVLPVCQIIDDPLSEEGRKTISAFVAGYAKLREWPTNNDHRKAVLDALKPFLEIKLIDDALEIERLLNIRKYVVLQGPPGTGKTRTAKKIAEKINAKTFFTQFHAETSYSDFIYGIQPDIENVSLRYTGKPGSFSEALKYASTHTNEKIILIIDEINRANLSNVLGPIFYLFEHKMDVASADIQITPHFSLDKLPDNFFVIATMNTADRSLAVVDFALRRRFAWFNKMPKIIDGPNQKLENVSVNKISDEQYFFKEDFAEIEDIFQWYASSNELNLQPGEGYFIAADEQEMLDRIKYEIFPLIKEYLQEGLLYNAKEEFNNYFSLRIKQSLYE